MRRAILKVYTWIFAIGLGYALLVMATGFSIPCFYRSVSGMLCPGCGVSRMFLAMLRLDFAEAFRQNAAIFLLLFPWNGAALLGILGKPALFQRSKTWYWMLGVTIGILLLFGILRNIC